MYQNNIHSEGESKSKFINIYDNKLNNSIV